MQLPITFNTHTYCTGPQQCNEGLTPALYGGGTGEPLAEEVARTGGPVFGCADLACGTEQGVACCTDGPACSPTSSAEFNSFPLTCVEGTCVSCGVDGAVPCPDSTHPISVITSHSPAFLKARLSLWYSLNCVLSTTLAMSLPKVPHLCTVPALNVGYLCLSFVSFLGL